MKELLITRIEDQTDKNLVPQRSVTITAKTKCDVEINSWIVNIYAPNRALP